MSTYPRKYDPYFPEKNDLWFGFTTPSSPPEKKSKDRPKRDPEDIAKLLGEKVTQAAAAMAPPKNYQNHIAAALKRVKESRLKVCAIDMELARIRMQDGSPVSVPVWIAIVDESMRLVYHTFVRHPESSIIEYDYGTECHGLRAKDVDSAKDFYTVREEVTNIFKRFDRIIASGQINDFAALFLSVDEHSKLLKKIVCVSSYYNCRLANDGLGIKYAAFLIFNVILQDETHSPLVDAAYTLYLYLMDFERIEKTRYQLKTTKLMGYYHGFVYPKNEHMSSLLMETMNFIGDWPDSFKYNPYDNEDARYHKIGVQKYKKIDYIPGTSSNKVPCPYKFDETRKKSLLSLNLKNSVQKTIDIPWEESSW